MKAIIFSLIFIGSGLTLAKKAVDLRSFNEAVGEDISEVISENPQMYETKEINRKPASKSKQFNENINDLSGTDKLDAVDEQANTHTSW